MADSVTVDHGNFQGRRIAHRRYASRATVEALIAAGRCDRISEQMGQMFDVVRCEYTEWVAVPDDDPRMNMVEHFDG